METREKRNLRLEEKVNDLSLLDGERVEVDVLEALDLLLVHQATQLGHGDPSTLLVLTATATSATTTTLTTVTTATVKSKRHTIVRNHQGMSLCERVECVSVCVRESVCVMNMCAY